VTPSSENGSNGGISPVRGRRGIPRLSVNHSRKSTTIGQSSSSIASSSPSTSMSMTSSPSEPIDSARDSLTSDLTPQKVLTRREQVMRQRELRLQQEQENLTFKPNTASTQRGRERTVTSSNVNRFDRLYTEAKARQEKGKNKKDETPSFKPTITALGQSKQRSKTPEGTASILYNTTGAGRRRSEVKDDKCTFNPTISKRGKSLERSRDVSPSTRLYSQAQLAQMKLAKKKEERSNDDIKECTFTPQTNKSRSASASRAGKELVSDVMSRMEKYNLQREKKLEQLRLQKEAEDAQVTTFKPTSYTKQKSRSSSRERGELDVFSRLHSGVKKPSEAAEQEWEKEHTFHPTLVTNRAPSPMPGDEGFSSVHDRLYVRGTQRKKELEQQKEELRKELEKELTFSPQVTRREENGDDMKGPVFERLSASRQYVHEILTQIKSEFEMDECTFRPTINSTSETLARQTNSAQPIHLRLSSEAEKLRQENEKRRLQKEAEEAKACTFTPELRNAFTHHVDGGYNREHKDVFDRLSVAPKSPEDKMSKSAPLAAPATTSKLPRRSNSSPSKTTPSKSNHAVPHTASKATKKSEPIFISRKSRQESSVSQNGESGTGSITIENGEKPSLDAMHMPPNAPPNTPVSDIYSIATPTDGQKSNTSDVKDSVSSTDKPISSPGKFFPEESGERVGNENEGNVVKE